MYSVAAPSIKPYGFCLHQLLTKIAGAIPPSAITIVKIAIFICYFGFFSFVGVVAPAIWLTAPLIPSAVPFTVAASAVAGSAAASAIFVAPSVAQTLIVVPAGKQPCTRAPLTVHYHFGRYLRESRSACKQSGQHGSTDWRLTHHSFRIRRLCVLPPGCLAVADDAKTLALPRLLQREQIKSSPGPLPLSSL